MTKHNSILERLVIWGIVILAYGYLLYKLLTFSDYDSLFALFTHITVERAIALVVCVLLFPLNIFLESLKWRYLLFSVEPMTLFEAQRQTYFGFVGAVFTPARIGDYPARITRLRDKSRWLEALALGGVGSLSLVVVILLLGVPASIVYANYYLPYFQVGYTIIASLLFILLLSLLLFMNKWTLLLLPHLHSQKLQLLMQTLHEQTTRRMLSVCMLSLLRFVVFCIQLYLIMAFCGVQMSVATALVAIPTYYLFVTLTPSAPVAEAAVRGSWAMIVFAPFSTNTVAIAMAAILLWIINSILPMLVGTVLHFQTRM